MVETEATTGNRRVAGRGRFGPPDSVLSLALAVAAGVGACFAGCHPTGTPVLDPLYRGVFAGVVVLAASRAARGTILWMAAVATAFSRGWLLAPAAAGLLIGFGGALRVRPSRWLGALAAAVSVQVVLRWPHEAFLGLTALVAAAATVPALVAALAVLSRRARRWLLWAAGGLIVVAGVLVVPLLVEGALARNQLALGIDNAEAALRSVSSGQAAGGRQQLALASADFASVSHRVGAWWTAGSRLVPVAAQQRQAVAVASSEAGEVSSVAEEQAGRIDYATLHYQAGGIDLAAVQALQAPLATVDARLNSAVSNLAAVDSQWLTSPISSRLGRLDREVVKAQRSASLAMLAVRDAPSLLGAQGTRHYLVAVLDPTETRGLGGLIVFYGEMTATSGHLSLNDLVDVDQLNQVLASHGGGHITGPPSYLARYGAFQPQDFVQDVSYAPDLPTVTQVFSQLVGEAGGPAADGLLMLDPRAIGALLSYTGPINAPGLGQLTSANAEQVIEKGEYTDFPLASQQTERRAALTAAMKTALSRLTHGSLPAPQSMADTLGPSVRRGDLLFWSVHPADHPFLDRLGMAGSFPKPAGGDLLAVVSQNAANNKIDAYLQRTIDDRVAYDPSNGSVSSTVTVTLHNSAPASGLSSEVIGDNSGHGLPSGTNDIWLSIYSPLELVSSSANLGEVDELGVHTYSGFLQVGPGKTAKLVVRLEGVVRRGANYRLWLYQQPMVNPDVVTAEVSPSGGGHGAVTWDVPTGLVVSRQFRVGG